MADLCVEWWQDFKAFQVLPYEGDLNAQPLFVYQAIRRCEIESVRMRNEEIEKLRKGTG